ncbi:MAG: hypothetical protein AAFV95_17580 [Bacteroidota bacterium]
MGKKEDIDKRIQQFLEGELNPEERQRFEQDAESDEELSREWTLHQDMEELLGESPENALRKSLQQLNAQADLPPPSDPSSSSSRFLWLLLIPVLLLIGWLALRDSSPDSQYKALPPMEDNTAPPKQENTNSPEQEEAPSTDPPIANTPSDTDQPEDPDKAPVKKPKKDPPKKKSQQGTVVDKPSSPPKKPIKAPEILKNGNTKEPPPQGLELKEYANVPISPPPSSDPPPSEQLLAAAFEPIPELDVMIDNPRRSDNIQINPSTLQEDFVREKPGDQLSFRFAGTITARNMILPEGYFTLYLLSNDRTAFEAMQGLVKKPLTLNFVETFTFRFNVQMPLSLTPGLYYYLIEDGEENIWFVDKFTIK